MKLYFLLSIVLATAPVVIAGDHISSDETGGYWTDDGHVSSDGNGGYWTKDGHVSSDGNGGYWTPTGHVSSDGNGGYWAPGNSSCGGILGK